MIPLYIDAQAVSLRIDEHSLVIEDKKANKEIGRFEPRQFPWDSILIQRPNGFITFAAINWLVQHNVNVTMLNWRGNVLAQILPEGPMSNEVKLAQYQFYLDRQKRLSIAKSIIQAKEQRQQELLAGLSKSYPVRAPAVPPFSEARSQDLVYLRNHEARYASVYFGQLERICRQLGFEFRGRQSMDHNQAAPDFVNCILNYSYSLLQTYVRRAINSVGLDATMPFLHEMSPSRGLVFDLMEMWRINSDYSVIQTMEKLNAKDKNHRLTDSFEAILSKKTIDLLWQNFRSNLSLEEIILNTRRFAGFLLGKSQSLEFALKPVAVKETFETQAVKERILTKSHRELGINKSSLWYMRQRLKETGSVRLYNKTKQHFVTRSRGS
jgi:CRISPR-associated protein Cas1